MTFGNSSNMEVDKMGTWLECAISPGQFTGECAVRIETYDNQIVSLFVPKSDIDIEEAPKAGVFSSGLIHVELIEEREGVALVSLPRETLENGQHIIVSATLLRQEA